MRRRRHAPRRATSSRPYVSGQQAAGPAQQEKISLARQYERGGLVLAVPDGARGRFCGQAGQAESVAARFWSGCPPHRARSLKGSDGVAVAGGLGYSGNPAGQAGRVVTNCKTVRLPPACGGQSRPCTPHGFAVPSGAGPVRPGACILATIRAASPQTFLPNQGLCYGTS